MMKRDGAVSEAVWTDKSIITVKPIEKPKGFGEETRKDYNFEVTYCRRIEVLPLQTRDL